jgi:hypothetical protein
MHLYDWFMANVCGNLIASGIGTLCAWFIGFHRLQVQKERHHREQLAHLRYIEAKLEADR